MKKLLSLLAAVGLAMTAGLEARKAGVIGHYDASAYCSLIDGYIYFNNGKLRAGSIQNINQALSKEGSNQIITATPTAAQLQQACGYATGLRPSSHATGLLPNNAHGICLTSGPCGLSGLNKLLPVCKGYECYNNHVQKLTK